MSRLPSQWIVWDHLHIPAPEDDDEPPEGHYLYALKATAPGERQAVLEGGSDRGVVAVVDFAGYLRKSGPIFYAWGAMTHLAAPVTNAVLRSDPVLSRAFSMRAGRAKRLTAEAAQRLDQLAGGLPEQRLPRTAPTDHAELELWTGARGRPPEFLVHDSVEDTKRLWRRIGFKRAPRRGHRLSDGTFPDLYSPEGIVGEVKNVIGPNWGPRQLQAYMRRLDADEPDRAPWRGVLVHGDENLSTAARRAIAELCDDGADITVWAIRANWFGRQRAVRQFP